MSPGAMLELGQRAKAAARVLALASSAAKNDALQAAADLLLEKGPEIVAANGGDVARSESAGSSAAAVDRLRLTISRVEAMADGLRSVAALPDPVGEVVDGWTRPN